MSTGDPLPLARLPLSPRLTSLSSQNHHPLPSMVSGAGPQVPSPVGLYFQSLPVTPDLI